MTMVTSIRQFLYNGEDDGFIHPGLGEIETSWAKPASIMVPTMALVDHQSPFGIMGRDLMPSRGLSGWPHLYALAKYMHYGGKCGIRDGGSIL